MRKLIMWNLITLDGYFEGEKNWDLSFHELVWGKELEDHSLIQLKSADMLVFGANTYRGMADYWTKAEAEAEAEGEIARFMNEIQKVVCSSTLKTADWNNTTIVKDAVAEIPELKKQGNGDMYVFGSGNLSESLMKAELFDEFRLCVVPVFLGNGHLLFPEGIPYKNSDCLNPVLLLQVESFFGMLQKKSQCSEKQKKFLKSLRITPCHAALSSFQSSGCIMRDIYFH